MIHVCNASALVPARKSSIAVLLSRVFFYRLANFQPSKYLRYPSPADSEKSSQSRPALELAGVKKGLVVPSQVQRIGTCFRGSFGTRFRLESGSRGTDCDDRRSP